VRLPSATLNGRHESAIYVCSGLSVVGCFFVLKMIGARSATPRCFDGLWCRALSDLEDFGLQIWSDQRPAAGSLLYVNSASWIVTLGTDEDDLRSSRTSTSRNLNTTRLYYVYRVLDSEIFHLSLTSSLDLGSGTDLPLVLAF
jgi:hypothetical protein